MLPDHFGVLAPFYDKIIKYADPEIMTRLADFHSDGRVLDIGGGTGRVAKTLHDRVSQIIVADISLGMLRQAVAKNLTVTCSHSEELPFENETFDRVIMVDAFHHVSDQHVTASELWRVLKPGGRILIVEPDILTFRVKLIALFEKLMLMRSHFLGPTAITNLFPTGTTKARIVCEDFSAWIVLYK